MWCDLETDVADLFAAIAVETRAMRVELFDRWSDPHEEADHWLSATDEVRSTIAPVYRDRLERVRQMNAAALVKVYRQVVRGSRAAYMRELRQRPDVRARQREVTKAWKAKNPGKNAEYLRAYRKRKAEVRA